MTPSERTVPVTRIQGACAGAGEDALAVEEPLEIRVVHGPAARRMRQRLTVTLRTPGHDADLAAGLLFAEGIIESAADLLALEATEPNVLRVELAPHVLLDPERIGRSFIATGSCGLCGKTMLEAIEAHCEPVGSPLTVPLAVIHDLPRKLREVQPTFARTGGLHAAALFDAEGQLLSAREDVGRHNAVDKVLGAEVRAGRGRLADRILLVSGRAGYELVQKAARMGVPVMVAVGAPTTLAVDLAERVGLTLLGFIRDGQGNCYSRSDRVR